MEKVKLEFNSQALEAVAKKAIEKKSGARGLKAIIEKCMLDVMYEIPSSENAREVHVDADVIDKGKRPLVVYDNFEGKKASNT
jgi:ATP-dependent Clp protease ATP-binding subunit ClpX